MVTRAVVVLDSLPALTVALAASTSGSFFLSHTFAARYARVNAGAAAGRAAASADAGTAKMTSAATVETMSAARWVLRRGMSRNPLAMGVPLCGQKAGVPDAT